MGQWQLALSGLSEVKSRGIGGGFQEPASGVYKVLTENTEIHSTDKGDSTKFFAKIIGGDFDGYVNHLYIGHDQSKVGNKRSWKTALLSHGWGEEDVNVEELTIDGSAFEGREAYINYKARDPNDSNSQSDRQFITKEAYEEALAAQEGATTAAGATKPVVKVVPTLGNKPGASAAPKVVVTPPTPNGAAKPGGALASMLNRNKQPQQ